MSELTWSKFFWSDWASDPALSVCSPGAQALWMRMLCVCATTGGYLTINGRALGVPELAATTGWPREDVEKWFGELEQWGVFSRDRHGVVFSRRMVRDEKRASNSRKNGKKGGNPNLGKDRENPGWVNPPDNPRSGTRARLNQKPEAISQKPVEESGSNEPAENSHSDAFAEARKVGDPDRRAWAGAKVLLTVRGGVKGEVAASRLFGAILRDHKVQARDLWPAIDQAWANGTDEPAAFLIGAARKRQAEAEADSTQIFDPDPDRQRRWAREYAETGQWRHERGPPPDRPGCRVSDEILAEFGIPPSPKPPAERISA